MEHLDQLLANIDQGQVVGALAALVSAWMLVVRRRHKRGRYMRRRRLPGGRGRRDFTPDERAIIFRNGKGRCFYCGVQVHYETHCEWIDGCNTCFQADHYIAYANGGPTTVDNGVVACRFHNQAKGAKHPDEFLAGGQR